MEVTYAGSQTVESGAPVTFNSTAVKPACCMTFREDSGIVGLRGMTSNRFARYFVDYSGNIALPTGGTPGEISLALAISGEPLESSKARVTPAAVENFFNVTCCAYIDIPRGCCQNISVENTSGVPIDVANSNLVITREA